MDLSILKTQTDLLWVAQRIFDPIEFTCSVTIQSQIIITLS